MKIYCCACDSEVDAMLMKGYQAYRDKPDRHKYLYFQCPLCGGCAQSKGGEPVGVIVPDAVNDAREHIQALIDQFGHGSNIELDGIRTVEKARQVYKVIKLMVKHAHESKTADEPAA